MRKAVEPSHIILFSLAWLSIIIRWLMLFVYASHTLNNPKKLNLENPDTRRRFVRNSQTLLTISLILFVVWLGVAINIPLGMLVIIFGIGLLLVLLSPLGTNRTLDKIIRQIQAEKQMQTDKRSKHESEG